MRKEICPQTVTQNRNVEFIDNCTQHIYLLCREKLTFVGDYYVAAAFVLFRKYAYYVIVRGYDVAAALQTDA